VTTPANDLPDPPSWPDGAPPWLDGAPRRPPPPELVAAAEADRLVMRQRLTEFIVAVRVLRAEGFTEFQACLDVYYTLRKADPLTAALMCAVAITQLAQHPDPYLEDPT